MMMFSEYTYHQKINMQKGFDMAMKNKVISALIAFIVIISLFTGCCKNNKKEYAESDDRFSVVYSKDTFFSYEALYVDNYTGVLYYWVHKGYAGGLTVLYNPDGSVMTYEQYKNNSQN